MTQRVAGKSVERKQDDIDRQDERPDANAKMADEEERANRVVPEKSDKEHSQIKKVAVDILQDEGESGFASIVVARRFTNSASRRIQEESAVVGFAIVITGCTKAERPGENQERGREFPPAVFRIDER